MAPKNHAAQRQSFSLPFVPFLMALLLMSSLPWTDVFAQTPTPIHVRRELIDYKPVHFYVAKVTDGRAKKDNIGNVFNGIANRPNTADIHGGVEKTLHDNLRWTLQRDSSKTPVEMEISHLLISETLETMSEYAELEMMVTFYDLSNNRQALYTARLKIEERLSVDVTASHERRIRTAMVQAIKDLDAQGPWGERQSMSPVAPPDTQVSGRDTMTANAFQSMKADSVITSPSDFKSINTPHSANNSQPGLGLGFMLLGSRQLALNSTGWIGSAYFFFNQDPNDWQVPFAIGFERLTISNEAGIRNGWVPTEISYRLPGLAAFKKLDDLVHLGLFINVPFGVERTVNLVSYQGIERNFIGVSGGLGVYFMSNTSASPVIGLRLHMMRTNSLAYPSDVGLRLEGGFRF